MNLDLDPESRLRRAADTAAAPDLDPALVSGAPDRRAPHLVNRGRTARAAGISLGALAMVAVGALVVGNPFAVREPLFTAAGSPGANGETAALSADSRMAMWVNYDYVAGEALSTSGGRGSAYELRRAGDPDSVLRAAAEALGLSGEVSESAYSSPEYPSYVIGPEDGSGASLTLSWAGTGDWWYGDPAATPATVCETVQPEPVDGVTAEPYEDCRQSEIPASASKAPSEDEARAKAVELFRATGLDVEPSEVRITTTEWETVASASLTVDGVTTALESSVAWSPLGLISWATGHSIDVVEHGGFDTVSEAAAVDRLSDWRWYGAAGPDYASGASLLAADAGFARDAAGAAASDAAGAPDAPVSSDGSDPEAPAAPGATTEPGDPGTGEPAEPAPFEEPGEAPTDDSEVVVPLPEPTPASITVTLEQAEATLLLMWDADGNAWLVPGYAYENPEDGFWTTVVSLVEGVVELPEPVEIDPLPAVLD